MIRDPSDGSVREVVDKKPQSMSTKAKNSNGDKPLVSSTTSGLPTGSQKEKNLARLDRSREWLKAYQEKRHARGTSSEQERSTPGDSGNDQGQAEPGI